MWLFKVPWSVSSITQLVRKLSIEGFDQASWPSHTLENHAQTIYREAQGSNNYYRKPWNTEGIWSEKYSVLSSLQLPYYNANCYQSNSLSLYWHSTQSTCYLEVAFRALLLLCAKRHWSNTTQNCFRSFWFQVGPVPKLNMHIRVPIRCHVLSTLIIQLSILLVCALLSH